MGDPPGRVTMGYDDPTAVLIGKKPTMQYVMAAVLQLNTDEKVVKIRARGNAIGTAVDVAEVARNKFVRDAAVEKVSIGTDTLPRRDGSPSRVSWIEIVLRRP